MLPHFTTNEARANNGQRGQGGGQMDAAVLSLVRRKRHSSSAPCPRLYLGNFLRTLATPEPIKDWSLTSLKEKLIKMGAKVVHPRPLCRFPNGRGRRSETSVLRRPSAHRGTAAAAGHVDSVTKFSLSRVPRKTTGDLRLDEKNRHSPARDREPARPGAYLQAAAGPQRHFSLVKVSLWAQSQPQ